MRSLSAGDPIERRARRLSVLFAEIVLGVGAAGCAPATPGGTPEAASVDVTAVPPRESAEAPVASAHLHRRRHRASKSGPPRSRSGLSRGAWRSVEESRAGALAELQRELDGTVDPRLSSLAGVPTPEVAAELLGALDRTLRSSVSV